MNTETSTWTTVKSTRKSNSGRGRKNTISKKKSKKTMKHYDTFCKVCYDAGKPKEVFTSHFLRESADPKSKIVCPTLLETVCKFCKEKGHTPKHCEKLKMRNKRGNRHRDNHHHHHHRHQHNQNCHHDQRPPKHDRTPTHKRPLPLKNRYEEEFEATATMFPSLSPDGSIGYKRKGTPHPRSKLWKTTVMSDTTAIPAPKFKSRHIKVIEEKEMPMEEKPVLVEEAMAAPAIPALEANVLAMKEVCVEATPEPVKKSVKKKKTVADCDSFW